MTDSGSGSGSPALRTTASGTRNGMPPSVDYEYNGTGEDTLTGKLAEWQLDAAARRATGLAGREGYGRRRRVRRTGTPDVTQGEHPAPKPAPAAPGAAGPAPARCPECQYLVTAPGHQAACGGAS